MKTFWAASLALLQFNSFAQETRIDGQITNRPNHPLYFYAPEDPIKGNTVWDKITTDSVGNFSFLLNLAEKKPVRLKYRTSADPNSVDEAMFILWMEPGKSLRISATDDSTLHYSGQLARENDLLKAVGLNCPIFSEVYDTTSFAFTPFARTQDSIARKKTGIVNREKAKGGLSPSFVRYIQTEIAYDAVFNKIQYAIEYTSAKNINYKQMDFPLSFRKFISDINFLTDDSYYSLKYRHGLWRYFDYLSFTTLNDTSESYTLHTFRLLDNKLKDLPRTREYLKSHTLKYTFTLEQDIDTLRACIESIKSEKPTSETIAYFENKWLDKVKLLYANKTLPAISLQDTTGARVSLNNLKGKVLLVDFWGSWCKPCMEEMPYSKQLYREIDSSKIAFVYINTGDTRSRWLQTINKLGLEGIHLHADDEAQKMLQSYYVFTTYPYYVVIDAEGKPFISKDPIRPSGNAKEILNTFIGMKSPSD